MNRSGGKRRTKGLGNPGLPDQSQSLVASEIGANQAGGTKAVVATVLRGTEAAKGLVALASMCVAALSLYLTISLRNQLAFPQQMSMVPRVLIDGYLNKPVVFRGNERPLRELRALAHHATRSKGCADYQAKIQAFQTASLEFDPADLSNQPAENATAYQVSLILEEIGLLSFTGGLPIRYVLVVDAYSIVEDWILCSQLVETKLRSAVDIKTRHYSGHAGEVPFNRRHAEWIACVSAMYLEKHWKGDILDCMIDMMGGIEIIKAREKLLRGADYQLQDPELPTILEELL
jgi:hypothetical protein